MTIPTKPDFSRLAALKKELEEQEAAYQEFSKNPEAEKIAEHAHSVICRWNHTDGCGWFYSTDYKDWPKDKYLEAAKKLIATGITYEQASKVLEAFRGI